MSDTPPPEDSRRPAGGWTLLAYLAGRWDGATAAAGVVSAASPLVVLTAWRAVGTGGPLDTAFLLAASVAPAVIAVLAWPLLWGGFAATYLTPNAAPLLRIAGDARLFRGMAGWVAARWLVALLAATPAVVAVAIASERPAFVAAAAASSAAAALLYEAALLPVRVGELHGRTWATVVAGGFLAAGWILYLEGRRWLYWRFVEFSEAPSATAVAAAAVVGGFLAFAVGWRLGARLFGAASDRFGAGADNTEDVGRPDRIVVAGGRRRRPRRLWSRRPGVVLAFRRVVFSGVGTALAIATVAAVGFAGAALATGPRASRAALAAESLTFGAWLIVTGAAVGFAFGPLHAIAAEKEDGTFGVLALAAGREEAVRSLAAGTRLGIVVAATPAVSWLAWRAVFGWGWPWWSLVVVAVVAWLVWLASVYGVWAAARSPGLSEAAGVWVVAVVALPMLLYAPRLLRQELRRPAAIEGG